MKNIHSLVSGLFIVSLLLLPGQSFAQTTTSDAEYRATLIQLIELLQVQISNLQAELDIKLALEESEDVELGDLSNSVQIVAQYAVGSEMDAKRLKNNEHKGYFARVFNLLPDEYDNKIDRVLVFEGEDVEFDAYVETLPPQHESWLYAAHEDILKDPDSDPNTELIVHELAHIISYEEIVGVPKPTHSTCKDYFETHGCPSENSYLALFTKTFWLDSDLDRAERFSRLDDSFEAAYAYYEEHEDEFVTDYAASGPEEDFAESFSYYVLEDSNYDNKVSQQKMDFFSQYSKMVSIRNHILENK